MDNLHPQQQLEMVANTALPEFPLLTNLWNSSLALFHGLDNFRPRNKASANISHSSKIGSGMVGWAQSGLLGEVANKELLLLPLFNCGLEGFSQFRLDELKALPVVVAY